MKLFAKFSRGLAKTSRQLGSRITTLFGQDRLDADTMQALEDALIQADLGPKLAQDLVAELVQNHAGKPDARQLREKLCELLYARIKPCEKPFDPSAETGHPAVVLVIGVNGAGKTTSIGKLASLMKQRQKRILVCAADTFRAAGGQQMRLWAERAAVDLIEGRQGSDAAAAVYESCARAREQGYDLLLIDTAGRLHTRRDLMDELAKINRVIEKQIPDAPHETLLVLDGSSGQNVLRQFEEFSRLCPVTGLIVTRLDGTARAGVLIALAARFAVPIYFIGIGEQIDDLQPFDAALFARALIGIDA